MSPVGVKNEGQGGFSLTLGTVAFGPASLPPANGTVTAEGLRVLYIGVEGHCQSPPSAAQ